MKHIYVLFTLIIHAQLLQAQSPNFVWANQYGNNGTADAVLLTLDEEGNRYMRGSYGTAGLTLGAFTLSGAGGQSNYIAKISPSGVVLWAKRTTRMGGTQDGRNSEKIAVDSLGNVYFTGFYLSGATIDGIPIPGESNYFLAKLNSSGELLWTRTTSYSALNSSPYAIHLDNQHNICMLGGYQGIMSFSDTYSLTAMNSSSVGAQSFLVKYNQEGDVIFATNIGQVDSLFMPAHGDAANDLFLFDENDNFYRFADTVLIKYNSSGVQLHQHVVKADSSIMRITSFAVDLNGNVLLSGDFTNGPLVFMGDTLEQNGLFDAIIIKLDSNGTKQWIHHNLVANNGSSTYSKIRVDGIGNIYATGKEITFTAVSPILMHKLSAQGDVLWDDMILSTNSPITPTILGGIEPRNIVLAPDGGNIFILGAFNSYVGFTSEVFFTTPFNAIRFFIAQYGNCSNTEVPTIESPSTSFCEGDSLQLTASESSEYLWNTGETTQTIDVNVSGDFYVFGIEDGECYAQSTSTTIHVLEMPNVNVLVEGETLLAEQGGASYQWINCSDHSEIADATNQTYMASTNGNYAVVITNANGCFDTTACYCVNSFIPTISSDIVQFCAGDSVLIVASDLSSYLWNTGATSQSIYTSISGDFYVVDIESSDCYAQSNTIQMEMLQAPNLNVFQMSETLTAEQEGATYQWINCNDNSEIVDATNQNFTATSNGDYAVVVTNASGCSDTTACFTVSTINIRELDGLHFISISPNPANNTLFIESKTSNSSIQIYDSRGRLVFNTVKSSNKMQIDVSSFRNGIYFVLIENQSKAINIQHSE